MIEAIERFNLSAVPPKHLNVSLICHKLLFVNKLHQPDKVSFFKNFDSSKNSLTCLPVTILKKEK